MYLQNVNLTSTEINKSMENFYPCTLSGEGKIWGKIWYVTYFFFNAKAILFWFKGGKVREKKD